MKAVRGLIVLDRDGVLNRMVFRNQVEPLDSPLKVEEVEVFSGVPDALRRLTEAGFALTLASNQPSAAKGKTTRADLDAVHARVLAAAEARGGRIQSSHVCYHRAEDGCECRKPRTGLLEAALAATPGARPDTSWIVGDRATDVLAGAALGFRTALLGPSRAGDDELLKARGIQPSFRGLDLQAFADFLLGGDHSKMAKVKLFSDGADAASLLEMAKDPRIAGFTTNPTLMRKAGVGDYVAFAKQILDSIRDRPISFEVFADDFAEMGRQARLIASWGPNVYVKVPITNTRGDSSLPLVKELSLSDRIQLNVTAICTLEQVHAATQALSGGAPAVISVFAGRIADTGRDPVPLMKAARAICDSSGASAELLWASPRELLNIAQAEEAGAHIITVPPDMLKKLPLFGKNLAEFSLETVQMFHRDAVAAGYEIMTDFTRLFLEESVQILRALDAAAIERLADGLAGVRTDGGRLFILGVGGSAGHASHAVNDFRKLCALEAYTPTDNVSELTARVNDDGWETSFSEWLKVSRLGSKDGVLVFSVGGGSSEKNVSMNLVRALEHARAVGAKVFGVVGKDGGYTAQVADACVVIPTASPSRVTPHTEGLCAVVWHLLVSHPVLQKNPTKWESTR